MILYLLKSAACLLILLLVHQFLLQRESMHRFNRFFLLFSIVVSFLIPVYIIEVAAIPVVEESGGFEILENIVQAEYPETNINSESIPALKDLDFRQEKSIPWMTIFWSVYFSITLVFLIRFVRNIHLLTNKISRNLHVSYRGETLVLLAENSLPFTFLKYIFVSKTYFEEGKLTESIFAHEHAHLQEKHSLDLLFIELLLVFFWFHPGLYFARQAIKLNHEFIADQAALQATTLELYQSQLLSMMVSGQNYKLASSLNFSLTKKRFEMMRRKTANSTKWIKIFSVIPVLAALVYFFSEKVVSQNFMDKKMSEVHIYPLDSEQTEKDYDMTVYLVSGGKFLLDDIRSTKIFQMNELSEIIYQKAPENPQIKVVIHPENTFGDVEEAKSVFRDHGIKKLVWMDPDGDNKVEELGVNVYSLVYGSSIQMLTKAEYYSETKFFVKYPDGEKEELSYDQFSEKYAKDLPNPPGKMKKSIPSSALFESWKNGDEFAIWIDGKVVPNSILVEMEVSEIAHYTSSSVYPNARSERFPQKNQVSIYTFSGFENVYGANSSFGKKPMGGSVIFSSENPKNQQRTLNFYPVSSYQGDYIQYLEMLNSGSSFMKKSKTEQEQLVQMFYDLGGKYSSLSAEDKKKVELPENPHLPFYRLQNDEGVFYKLEKDLSEEEKKHFSKSPPIFPYDKNIVTVSNYLKEFGEFQVKINKNRLFAQPSNQEIMGLQSQFRSLQASYNSLPFEERRKVKRASFPYARLEKDGKEIFKRFEDLTEEELKSLEGC